MKTKAQLSAILLLAISAASLIGTRNGVQGKLESTASAATAPTVTTLSLHSNAGIAYVLATPNAQCTVHPTGQSSPSGVAMADDQGVVRFYTPPASWGTQLSVDCGSAGNAATYHVDLTESATFQSPLPSPAPQIRPPLTGDPMSYTQEWLVQHEYLRRPDPKSSPAIYAAWLKGATQQMTIAHKEPIAKLDEFNDNFRVRNNSNWAGAALNAGVQYLVVAGVYAVPPTNGAGGDTSGKSSVWVGLDGVNEPDVLQVGIEADYNQAYQPWIEYFPNNLININNLTVNLRGRNKSGLT